MTDILTLAHAALRCRSTAVEQVDGNIRVLAERMSGAMYAANGVGLAAPQVGVAAHVIVVDVSLPHESPAPLCLIKPDIPEYSKEMIFYEEGCLSDHAPHRRDAKLLPYPQSPSGMPGVQTLLPLMLNHVPSGHLSLRRLVNMTSAPHRRLFELVTKGTISVGYDADFSIVDLNRTWTGGDDWFVSKCGGSPFAGTSLTGPPVGTIIRGQPVIWEDEVLGKPSGRSLRFEATDIPSLG